MLDEYWSKRLEEALENARIGREKAKQPKPEPIGILPPLPVVEIKKTADQYRIRHERGHYTVYKNGKFFGSAETRCKAEKLIP